MISEVYNGDNRDCGPEIVRLIREELGPLIKGTDIFEGERIWSKLFALTLANRDRKTLLEAIACVDCAVWDVVGKATGRSVGDLLGGFTDKVPIISIGGYYMEGKTLADIGREMEAYRRAGMAGCKFKVGGLSPQADAQRVEAARKAAGPDFILAVDANRGWTADEAIHFASLVEPLGIRWFEEPCHWYDDAAQMARVRSQNANTDQCGPIRDHQPRRSPPDRRECRRYRQLRRFRGGWCDRLAARGRAMCDRRRGDCTSRGVANRAASDLCHPPRHLHRVLCRPRT